MADASFTDGTEVRLLDLPGTYNLTAYSAEEPGRSEATALERQAVAIVCVIDASNLERNLCLLHPARRARHPRRRGSEHGG